MIVSLNETLVYFWAQKVLYNVVDERLLESFHSCCNINKYKNDKIIKAKLRLPLSFPISFVRQQLSLILLSNTMQIEMGIPQIIQQPNPKQQAREALNSNPSFVQSRYRWVIVALTGMALLLNGLVNQAITPLEHKMTLIYDVSPGKVSASVILSFVVFFVFNFPANQIIDSRGLRISFIIGASLYFLGTLFYTLINKSYNFVILGTFFIGAGQPFLINCPAKIAAFWFFPKNRALATALMVGVNILGMGIGFLIPTLVVSEQSVGDEAHSQIGHLYLGYLIYAGACLILVIIFMKSQPEIAPSEGATAHKLSSIKQTFLHIKQDKNLWKFFPGYCFGYGTLITFGANSNFIMKPYDYSDIQIAVNGVLLMVFGTVGAILFSLYLKRTSNYSRALRVASIGSTVMLLLLCLWINTANIKVVTSIVLSVMGFVVTPVIPICYDLGCQLSFPMGEAQVTGLLNGGGLLWAFISSAFVSGVFGYGSTKSSLVIVLTLSGFVLVSAVLFFFLKIDLKRRNYEIGKGRNPQEQEMSDKTETTEPSEQPSPEKLSGGSTPQGKQYNELIQQPSEPEHPGPA